MQRATTVSTTDDEGRSTTRWSPTPAPSGADARRAQIAAAAAELFNTAGYFQTTMEDIAASVSIAKPTLYHYFRAKDEILFHIHDEFLGLLFERHESRAGADRSAVEELLETMTDLLDLMSSHPGHVRAFFEHHRQLPEDRRAEVTAKRDAYKQVLEAVVQRGIDRGEIRAVDVSMTALAVFGMCNWTYQWFRPDGSMTTRQIAEVFWDLLIGGLVPRERAEAVHRAGPTTGGVR